MSQFATDTGNHPRASADDVSAFLKRLRPEARPAFLAVRAVAVTLGPDVGERVDGNSVTYLRRERPFLDVRAMRSHVNVLFPPGIEVKDPMGRLLRRGDEHYVVIDGADELDGHVEEFLRKAYAAAR